PPPRYPLSLHDALPIWKARSPQRDGRRSCTTPTPTTDPDGPHGYGAGRRGRGLLPCRLRCPEELLGWFHGLSLTPVQSVAGRARDRKSTRLNSSHDQIS